MAEEEKHPELTVEYWMNDGWANFPFPCTKEAALDYIAQWRRLHPATTETGGEQAQKADRSS